MSIYLFWEGKQFERLKYKRRKEDKMINRVLIRMKTVQLLYSYLLVEKPFMLESQPSNPTKEKRFAYSLYLDIIYMVDKLAHQIMGKNKSYPLSDSRFVMRSEGDERLIPVQKKYSEQEFPFNPILPELTESIKDSLLFKEYEKKKAAGEDTDSFWEDVINAIILPNPSVNKIIRELPNYSLSGVERMKSMMEVTLKNFYSSKGNLQDALQTLERSMLKARDLYMRLLALPVELTSLRLAQLEQNRKKYLATVEDLNPNMRFVNNRIPEMISANRDFEDYVEKNHLSWYAEDPELLAQLLKAVLESNEYKRYEELPETDLMKDTEFWRNVINDVILENQDFLEYLENKSVFWNDDLEIMASFVLKTLKRMENAETQPTAVLPMYKDGDDGKDAKFGAELFRYVVNNKDAYKKLIEEVLSEEKWSADRLAFMDVVVTMCAMAEILNYPEIPLAVSVNEYVEIAKSYSSEKSGQFVHGLIASIISKLKVDGMLHK